MRSRQKSMLIRLSEEEFCSLQEIVQDLGISRESYVRSLLKKEVPRGQPSKEYLDVLVQLRKIGTNINQLTMVAHKTHSIDMKRLNYELERLNQEIATIKKIASQPLQIKEE